MAGNVGQVTQGRPAAPAGTGRGDLAGYGRGGQVTPQGRVCEAEGNPQGQARPNASSAAAGSRDRRTERPGRQARQEAAHGKGQDLGNAGERPAGIGQGGTYAKAAAVHPPFGARFHVAPPSSAGLGQSKATLSNYRQF
ncbi:TPA: hypothetical protein PXJ39_004167 [Yersinia enterocolitica]|nr:hypothetical protein [Yersinia enterocolitica]